MKSLQQQDRAVRRGIHKNDALAFVAFILLFTLLLYALEILFYDDSNVCTVWETIEAGEGPEVLIMGSSHAFTAYIPDIITGSTGLSCGVLGSSSENMFLTLENFKTVLHSYTPDVIILEAFSVIERSRVTLQTEKQEYMYRDIDGMRSIIDRIRAACHVLRLNDIPFGVSQLFRPQFTWSRWENLKTLWEESPPVNRYKRADVNGYIFRNTYTGGTVAPEEIEDALVSLYRTDHEKQIDDPVNEAALISFLELAQERRIPVLIFKSPTLRADKGLVHGMNRIKEIAADYECCQLVQDFHLSIREIGLNLDDFYDSGHMNRRGAVKFTTWFLEQGFLPSQPEPDYSSVFAYRTETIEQMNGNGWYRYTMENFDRRVKYRFRLGNEVIKDWSTENFCELELDPARADQLYCDMVPVRYDQETRMLFKLSLPFMKQNSSEVSPPG